ncbi:MAG: dienelactone hydrolase family protein [Bacteroidota bacterium]|nr:dienelactone hydrolase family protein [Candidatus Kapabacteria bacterium]MDW8221096.1 dienelactone hydrolase family protein [Bacteroidota bacterium]
MIRYILTSLTLMVIGVAFIAFQFYIKHSYTSCCTWQRMQPTISQHSVSDEICCTANKKNSSIVRFAAFASEPAFVQHHAEPLSYALLNSTGTVITVKASDGTQCFGYEVVPSKFTRNVVFVFHEWWGLNNYIKQEAEKLSADLSARVIALDLYDGRVATSREEASKYMQSSTPERSRTIIAAFQRYVGPEAKIATIGWCFGGGWSHQAALMLGKQAVGCVIYYGMPEMDSTALTSMNAPTLGIFARNDRWITPEVVARFEATAKALGKEVQTNMYDADHAFANPSNPRYQRDMAQEAYTRVIAFLKRCFA